MLESSPSEIPPLPGDWTGTAAQLAEALILALPRYALSPEPLPSERLIRFYVSSGVLLKPQREGREALFGQRQALQFLAARALLEDGWPLAKVASYLEELSDSELLALLPQREVIAPASAVAGAAMPTRAQQLIARFRKSAEAPPAPASAAPVQQKSLARPVIPLPAPGGEALKERQAVRAARLEEQAQIAEASADELYVAEESTAVSEREVRVHITLTPWCEIALHQDSLNNLTPDDVESATTLFRAALEREVSE
ncbi:MAG: MerR family transcriptional regulator [Armatimonas sp.]